jgi:putative membrane protein
MMTGFGMGFGLIGILLMLLLLGGLIALAVLAIRALAGTNPSAPDARYSSTAREILDQRYARGEITREQYEQMKTDLL